MSRFYAEIKGNRGMASRTGFKDSGMWSHTRGWKTGVEVQCSVDEKDEDIIEVYATGGSGHSIARRLIATIFQDGFVQGCQIHLSKKEETVNILLSCKDAVDGLENEKEYCDAIDVAIEHL